MCGAEECKDLFYNSDYTSVCKLTGACFGQRLCDTYIDCEKGINNTIDVPFYPKIKKDQQLRNKKVDHNTVRGILTKMNNADFFKNKVLYCATNQICSLWKHLVNLLTIDNVYCHRKDLHCFVVAIVFSLRNGLKSTKGPVVVKHPTFRLPKLNKKKNYKVFEIKMIRYGVRLIKNIFKKHEPPFAINLN